jgi:hypothetical protein
MLGTNETIPATRSEAGGILLTSGVRGVVLGPLRVDQYPYKGFGVFNHGTQPLTVNVEINHDHLHGAEAYQGTTGAQAAVDPNPAYWVAIGSMSVAASGSAATTHTTPCPWVRLTCTPTLPGQTVSGFMHASSM